jgi:Ser/Thr protein kinase RdoA (MazF antagonist)
MKVTAVPTSSAIASFTAGAAVQALTAALAANGVHGVRDFRLLQDPSDNAVIHVAELEVVARIAGSESHYARLGKELAVAAWVARHSVPAAAPAHTPPTPQLTVAGARVITWWEYLPNSGTAAYADHGALLARLHQVPVPPFLPPLDPWARTSDQISLAALALPADDIDVMLRERARLRRAWESSPWMHTSTSVVHGDPYIGNSLNVDGAGAHLLDFEDSCVGPPAWDFASVLGAHRLGWVTGADWTAFCDGFGADLSNLPAMDVLADVLAFRRCCWLASTVARHGDRIERARHRIATLSLPLEDRGW